MDANSLRFLVRMALKTPGQVEAVKKEGIMEKAEGEGEGGGGGVFFSAETEKEEEEETSSWLRTSL